MVDQTSDALPFEPQISSLWDFQTLLNTRLTAGTHALHERGIRIFISRDLRRLANLNRRHASSWGSLFPAMDPDQARFDQDHAFMIEGRDEAGSLVFTDAVRRLDIARSNFKAEFETMRAYYGDPEAQRGADEWIEITAPASTEMQGRVGLVGGLWVAPERRGSGLTQIFAPLVRWYAHGLWSLDWVAAFVHETAVAAGVARGYGYASSEALVRMHTHAVKSDLHLLSQCRSQLEAHIRLGPDGPVPHRSKKINESN